MARDGDAMARSRSSRDIIGMSKLSDDRKRQLREKHHDNPIESKRRARVTYLRRRWSQHWADPNGVSAPEYHGADYAGRGETDVALGISRAEFVQIGTQTREAEPEPDLATFEA